MFNWGGGVRRMDYNVDCESEDGSNIFYLISLIEKKKKQTRKCLVCLPCGGSDIS